MVTLGRLERAPGDTSAESSMFLPHSPSPRAYAWPPSRLVVIAVLAGAATLASWGALAAPRSLPPGASYEIGFTPSGSALRVVLGAIDAAQMSILVAAYEFTSQPVAKALLAAQSRGVRVSVVADAKEAAGRYSAVTFLANNHVPVRVDGHYDIHHHKFMVIDSAHLETGSMNYTAKAATRNAENVMLLRNVPPIAQEYAAEWKRLWDESTDVRPNY